MCVRAWDFYNNISLDAEIEFYTYQLQRYTVTHVHSKPKNELRMSCLVFAPSGNVFFSFPGFDHFKNNNCFLWKTVVYTIGRVIPDFITKPTTVVLVLPITIDSVNYSLILCTQ